MKNDLRNLDAKIRAALGESGLEDVDTELGLHQEILETFRGRLRWLIAVIWFWCAVIFVLAVYSGFRFFQADETKMQLAWGIGCAVAMMAVSSLKTWYWMELNKNAITREIKRLELQVAHLGRRFEELR